MIQLHHLEGLNDNGRELLAAEAFLRRAAALGAPFVLKGSMLTRQYMTHPEERPVEDMDLLYMEHLNDPQRARGVFTHWLKQLTETEAVDDGVRFRSFSKNAFFRRIDYAMSDDFPTVNTDIGYWFVCENRDEEDYDELFLDISFNLDMPVPPIPLEYKPVAGPPIYLPFSVPLSVQVAWKLHQTIVRARFKDLQDLELLLAHPDYTQTALDETLRTLKEECLRDNLPWPDCARHLFCGGLADYYDQVSKDWEWRRNNQKNGKPEFQAFAARLQESFHKAGINEKAFLTL